MITNFYVLPQDVKDKTLLLTGEEAFHISSVLRYHKGQIIPVVDGLGNKFEVEIINISKRKVEGNIVSLIAGENELKVWLTLACGISRGTKMDWVIEKGTELGVKTFIPMLTENTLMKWESRKAQAKIQRWQKIARAAMKQSLRSFLPEIEMTLDFEKVIEKNRDYDLTLMATFSPRSILVENALQNRPQKILLLVGPEEGFTEKEEKLALENKIIFVSLGKRRLRTETAGIVLTALVSSVIEKY